MEAVTVTDLDWVVGNDHERILRQLSGEDSCVLAWVRCCKDLDNEALMPPTIWITTEYAPLASFCVSWVFLLRVQCPKS